MDAALDPASPDGRMLEWLSIAFFVVGGLVLSAVAIVLLVALARGNRGSEAPLSTAGSWILVISGGLAAPILAIAALVASGLYIGETTEAGPVEGRVVEVVGKRWWWEVRYLDEAGDAIAVTANEIHLPVGFRSRIRLLSDNVIHSFWVPALQGKTDLIPGRENITWVEPEAPGIYRGQCAEFCGIQHTLMGFMLVAEAPATFESWLSAQAAPADADPVGLSVFMAAGCGACHTIRGTAAVGDVGPDLTHLASRRTLAAGTIPNTRGNLGGWITSPQHVKPGALMPPTILSAEDLRRLLDFLESLR